MSGRQEFEGRTALITGGAGDIGGAVARRLQAGGARVASFDLRAAELEGVLSLTGDVSNADQIDAAVARSSVPWMSQSVPRGSAATRCGPPT